MDRFIAITWDRARGIPPQAASARAHLEQDKTWRSELAIDGLCVFTRQTLSQTTRIVPLQHEDGIVLGVLFRRFEEAKGPLPFLDRRESARVVESAGEYLISEYWGAYVALWRKSASGEIGVLRDPSGALGCYLTPLGDAELFFSHAEDAARLPGVSFSIDWTALQAFLTYSYFYTAQTGLKEVRELLPGQRRLRQGGGVQSDFVWNGAEIAARKTAPVSFAQAKTALHAKGAEAFSAWSRAFDGIIVSLSGGLDSSLMLGLLAQNPAARITALNHVGRDYEGAEAALARHAARHAGVELIEMPQDPARDRVKAMLDQAPMARPKLQTLGVGVDEAALEAASRVGAEAFMLGHGGDNLFLQRALAADTLTDYRMRHGIDRGFWREAYWAGMLQDTSIMAMIVRAFKGRGRWRPFAALDRPAWREGSLLALDAPPLPYAYTHHPWLSDAHALPPGKQAQLVSMLALYLYTLDHGRGLTHRVVYPWMSQPILEQALATPTYVLCHGGQDRALERAAFAAYAPEAILRRTAKGAVDHYQLEVMRRNLGLFRGLALEGEIASSGLIDRARLERALSSERLSSGEGAMFVYTLVAAEAWLMAWRKGPNPDHGQSADAAQNAGPTPFGAKLKPPHASSMPTS